MRDDQHQAGNKPIMIAFAGASGTGKTYLLTNLTKELTKRGLKVGAVKHSRSGFQLDLEGKDSARLKQAGARTVLLAGPGSIGLIADHDGPLTPEDVSKKFFSDMDIVLVEGWKESGLPKIWVRGRGIRHAGLENIIAEVGEGDAISGAPLFSPEDIGRLTDFILSFNRRSQPCSHPRTSQDNT
jgi:molybdopterin-guanine dinucleotide biosynthesis protein MobB